MNRSKRLDPLFPFIFQKAFEMATWNFTSGLTPYPVPPYRRVTQVEGPAVEHRIDVELSWFGSSCVLSPVFFQPQHALAPFV